MGIGYLRSTARRVTCAIVVAVGLLAASGAGASAAVDCQAASVVCRAESFFPSDPVNVLALADLGSTGAPDDDLLSTLGDLAAADNADNADDAAEAKGRALAILEGRAAPLVAGDEDFLDRKAYNGIALLNTQAKVQDVATGTTTVDIREVRFGDHALLDTSMLRFEDMGTPFTIRWQITELGTSFGGELSPAAVPASGHGQNALVEPLELGPLITGTSIPGKPAEGEPDLSQRFHPDGGPEETRLATQTISVAMPAPNELGGGILDPSLKPGRETFAQIAVGNADAAVPAMPATDAAIAAASPERQIFDALTGTAAVDVPQLEAAVGAMRSRDTLPIPSLAGSADAGVAFANAEAYVSKRGLRLAPDTSPDGTMTLALTNLDDVPRDVVVRELKDRSMVGAPDRSAPGFLGTVSWGSFTTDALTTVHLPAKMAAPTTVTVKPAAGAFSLWVGDPQGGDQAGTAITLDRGPRTESLELGLGPVKPLHEAFDANTGHLWVTLANSDEVVRMRPTQQDITSQAPEHFPLPGGIVAEPQPEGQPPVPVLGPGDVAIDKRGIVYVTLTAANAIARIDPKVAQPGTTAGIKILPLTPCTGTTCRKPAGPIGAAAPLSRLPLQLKVRDDGAGNTDLFFTEMNADAIGALKVSPAGNAVDQQHFPCVCLQPLGVALDPNGDIWYSEGLSNRIGRLTLDATRPFSTGDAVIKHYKIPNPVPEAIPGGTGPACGGQGQPVCAPGTTLPATAATTLPHSVVLDRKGRVWYTGEASETVGYLDPAKAVVNTTQGFHDTAGPVNEFGRVLAPADLAIASDGTAYIADEYGDQIATAKINEADGSIVAKFGFRPTARNSLTDSPMIDPHGNLWFVEGGANLITRISNVAPAAAAPAPVPGTPPAAPRPTPTPTPAPAAPKESSVKAACATNRWLSRTGSGRAVRRTMPLIGMNAAAAQRCFGKPTRTSRTATVETWVYPTLDLRFSRGRVSAFTLRRAGLRSDPDRAAVGASVASFRKALGALARSGRGYRGVVAVGKQDVADIRLAVSGAGRVSRVTVTLMRRSALDRAGRGLLGRIR